MCYGGLETKYLLRDIEARMKSVAFEQDKSEEAAPAAAFGPLVWAHALLARLLRKGALNV